MFKSHYIPTELEKLSAETSQICSYSSLRWTGWI